MLEESKREALLMEEKLVADRLAKREQELKLEKEERRRREEEKEQQRLEAYTAMQESLQLKTHHLLQKREEKDERAAKQMVSAERHLHKQSYLLSPHRWPRFHLLRLPAFLGPLF